MTNDTHKCSLVLLGGEKPLFGMAAVLRLIKIRGGWDECLNSRYINPSIMFMNREFYYNYTYTPKINSMYNK